ncbi:hypothetical protein EON68_01095 [archaeon]|nr:MAG: hypothetical protein EON68_01095 [archaeon]
MAAIPFDAVLAAFLGKDNATRKNAEEYYFKLLEDPTNVPSVCNARRSHPPHCTCVLLRCSGPRPSAPSCMSSAASATLVAAPAHAPAGSMRSAGA